MTGILGKLEEISNLQASAPPEQSPARSPNTSRFEKLANQVLDEAGIAKSLGPQGLLLRVTFDPEGRLVWGALRPEGPNLTLAGFGAGMSGDLQRLRWAAAQHDFSMGLLHWMTEMQPLSLFRHEALQALLAALRALLESADPCARVVELMEILSTSDFPAKVSASILRLFRILSWPLADETNDQLARQELRIAERFVVEIDQQPGGRRALNTLTSIFLRNVAEIWDLALLETVLTPETDLVVQADDALHAVPVAWLQLNDQPLYHRVRSVRASLAPQLDALLKELDLEPPATAERRLLSISYFKPKDPAREAGKWLHHGHLRLADRFGAICVAGADVKTGTVGSVRAALEQYGSFATAAICGHGDFEQAGIRLGGEEGEEIPWQGQGCDLSRVGWLLLVSCSIGRVSRTGDLDVEGFCVQLAVHRARSILACRWPVLCDEAVAFANEAVSQFLELDDQPDRRTLALAAARRTLCEGEDPLVGLNTAAAFELYGLG